MTFRQFMNKFADAVLFAAIVSALVLSVYGAWMLATWTL